jgi:hypothetical protein
MVGATSRCWLAAADGQPLAPGGPAGIVTCGLRLPRHDEIRNRKGVVLLMACHAVRTRSTLGSFALLCGSASAITVVARGPASLAGEASEIGA